MNTIRNIMHRNQDGHAEDLHETGHSEVPVSTHSSGSNFAEHLPRADGRTMDRLGDEPNITGTDREPPVDGPFGHHEEHRHHDKTHKHHLGRDAAIAGAVGGAGYEAEKHHRRHQERDGRMQQGSYALSEGTGSARSSAELGTDAMDQMRMTAEMGNNFPGTNPHPAHSALGSMSAQGSLFPGRH